MVVIIDSTKFFSFWRFDLRVDKKPETNLERPSFLSWGVDSFGIGMPSMITALMNTFSSAAFDSAFSHSIFSLGRFFQFANLDFQTEFHRSAPFFSNNE
jgi:hypothetical protein